MSIVKNRFCPKCSQPIYYDGNYYCIGMDDGTCDWAMNGRNTEFNRDIIRTYLIQEREKALAEGNEDRVARMEFHLINLEEHGV